MSQKGWFLRGPWGSFLRVLKVVRVCWICMVLNGFGALGGAGGGGPLLLPRMRKVAAVSSKIEGTPPGRCHFGVIFWTPDVAHTYGVYDAF